MATTDAGREGWKLFAGLMILLVGIFNVIDGVVILADPKYVAYYATTNANQTVVDHHLVFGDLTFWGWTLLILGVLQALVATFVLLGRGWAALVAMVIVGINALWQLLFIGVEPWWSVLVIAIDVLVLYALVEADFTRRARTERAGP